MEPKTKKWKTERLQSKQADMLRSIGNSPRICGVSPEEERKAAVRRICRKGRF